ncbi:MAG: hypothetical protein ACRD04_10405 [Terriglobales bacterium]
MAVLIAAALGMPRLVRRQRELAAQCASAALRADAAESSLCGYMAWIGLAGLALHSLLGWTWADPLAALGLVPMLAREAWSALRGNPCCD